MLTVDDLEPGDLLITEWMPNPTCASDACEWIEIYNTTALPIELLGLGVRVGGGSPTATVETQYVLPPGEFAVLDTGGSWPYPEAPDVTFSGSFAMPNDPASYFIKIGVGLTEFDRTATISDPGGPDTEGVSLSLDPDSFDSVASLEATAWCRSTTLLLDEMPPEFGTPGAANDQCD